jgi:hypothetical protein
VPHRRTMIATSGVRATFRRAGERCFDVLVSDVSTCWHHFRRS